MPKEFAAEFVGTFWLGHIGAFWLVLGGCCRRSQGRH